jgi:hypothetical protein
MPKIACRIHALSPAEQKHHVYEKELLALVIALRTWNIIYKEAISVYIVTLIKSLKTFRAP